MSNHRATRTRRDRRTAPVMAAVVVIAVIGASATAATFATPGSVPDPTAAPTETAPALDPQTEPGAITDAGYVAQTVDVPAAMPNMDGTTLLAVNVTDITTGFECTADGAQAPEHGQYIALTVEARPGDAFAGELEMYPLNPADFTALGGDGGQPEDTQGNAANCIPAEDALPPVLTADGPVTGLVVLDAPAEATSVLYVPGGWEWAIPTQR